MMEGAEGVKGMVFWKPKAWNIFRCLWVRFSTQIFVSVLPVPARDFTVNGATPFGISERAVVKRGHRLLGHLRFLNLRSFTFFHFDSPFFSCTFFSLLGNTAGDRAMKIPEIKPCCDCCSRRRLGPQRVLPPDLPHWVRPLIQTRYFWLR